MKNWERKLSVWMREYIKEEMRHGLSKKTAVKRAQEVVDNLLALS